MTVMNPPITLPPTLETVRLILRPLTLDDVPTLFRICSNPNVTANVCFATHESTENARNYLLHDVIPRYQSGAPGPFGIVLREHPNEVIGCIGGRWENEDEQRIDLGYHLAEEQWRHGYTSEAVAAVVPYLFDNFPVLRLQARVFDGNTASQRVLLKNGFIFEGTLRQAALIKGRFRDVHFYSRLRSEYEAG